MSGCFISGPAPPPFQPGALCHHPDLAFFMTITVYLTLTVLF